MSGPRYSIVPADALSDERVTDLHLRVLVIMGSHSDRNGWRTINQRTIAEVAKRQRETINRKIAELTDWGYLRTHGRIGWNGRRLVDQYQVVADRDLPNDEPGPVTDGSQCDPPVTGYVTQPNHRVCDPTGSQQRNDLYLERPLSPNSDGLARAKPNGRREVERNRSKRKPISVADAAANALLSDLISKGGGDVIRDD